MDRMKQLTALLCVFVLGSCSGTISGHRMKAADRKLRDVHSLQSEGRWTEARERAEGMRGSVAKSVRSRPVQRSADGTEVNLTPMLVAWEQGPWSNLSQALAKQSTAEATVALAATRQQCTSCHLVLGRKDIVVSELPVR